MISKGENCMHHHHHHQREQNQQSLIIAILITTSIMILEFFGGLITKSLALLSDSGHMLSDLGSLVVSLIAIYLASKPPTAQKTYGYHRFEILAALFNGVTLITIACFILWQAIQRLLSPEPVSSSTMIIIAIIGLIANLFSAWTLLKKGDVKGNMNLRSAYLHILADALGSIGAIIAGILMLLFSWYVADPIISMIVALLILKSAWKVTLQSIHILMEGTPSNIDRSQVEKILQQIPGVINVHDLHIWTITSHMHSLSCHLLIENTEKSQQILQQAIQLIEQHFHIEHTTIQIETSDLKHPECRISHQS